MAAVVVLMTLFTQPPTGINKTKAVSAREAGDRFAALLRWSVKHNSEVVVETQGQPQVVIMPFGDYQQFVTLRQKARRQQAIAELKRLRKQVQARNKDLTEAEAEKLALRFSRDVLKAVVKKRGAKYG
jgi:PHD/YefM family antitoxin component YafN of YafNO toxin-antitoxin module